MRVVTHIRNLFLANQDYSIGHSSNQIHSGLKSSLSLVIFCLHLFLYIHVYVALTLHEYAHVWCNWASGGTEREKNEKK